MRRYANKSYRVAENCGFESHSHGPIPVCKHTRRIFFSVCSFFHIMNCAVCNGMEGSVQSINGFFLYCMVSLVHTLPYFSDIRNTGRFIMLLVITNIYNKKTKGPTLMKLFTATGKLEKLFFDN